MGNKNLFFTFSWEIGHVFVVQFFESCLQLLPALCIVVSVVWVFLDQSLVNVLSLMFPYVGIIHSLIFMIMLVAIVFLSGFKKIDALDGFYNYFVAWINDGEHVILEPLVKRYAIIDYHVSII